MNKLFLRLAASFSICGVLAMWAFAEEPQLRDPVPATYTVVKGDTLWDISGKFLQNPWMWPEIWHVNAQIENPHLIYPGDVIRLIYVDGQPRLTLDTSGRVYKLSPTARVLSAGEAIETIPLEKINSFLSRSRIVDEKEIEAAPYVLAGESDHLVSGAGDKVYARGEVEGEFFVYGIFRKGEEFKDPITKEKLGVQALDIGTGEVRAIENDISTLYVTRTTEEIRAGDRLLREEERAIDSTFIPSPPSTEVNGVILAVEGGVNQVGKFDVVVINKGDREGMTPGNVLAVYKRGSRIKDRVTGGFVTLPNEKAGLVMIFRTFEKVSFGLILEAEKGIKVNDIVMNP